MIIYAAIGILGLGVGFLAGVLFADATQDDPDDWEDAAP